MDKLISIIIPIYNVEPYLQKCLDSLLNQTYKKLEIILVDDGSTDNCPTLCDTYAEKDSRIIVIHKENGGLSSARNSGLDIAHGDYIYFADSDDWLETSMLETLLSVAINTNADIVSCGVNYIYPNKKETTSSNTGEIKTLTMDDVYKLLFDGSGLVRSEVWNKLYKREIIDNIRFKNGQIYEDVYFDRMTLSKTKNYVTIDIPFYNYRINRDGSTNSFFKKNRFSIFSELTDFCEELLKKNKYDLAALYNKTATRTAINLYISARRMNVQAELIQKCIDNFFKFYSPSNPYMKGMRFKLFALSPKVYFTLSNLKYKISRHYHA